MKRHIMLIKIFSFELASHSAVSGERFCLFYFKLSFVIILLYYDLSKFLVRLIGGSG